MKFNNYRSYGIHQKSLRQIFPEYVHVFFEVHLLADLKFVMYMEHLDVRSSSILLMRQLWGDMSSEKTQEI